MRASVLWTLLGCSIGAPLALGASNESAQRQTTISIELRDHFPIVLAKVGQSDVPLIFDSGDQTAVALHQDVLDSVAATPTGKTDRLQFAEGPPVVTARYTLPRIQIGDVVFNDIEARVDVHDRSYQATDVGQKGFLGTALLKPYQVVLDYRRRRMTLIRASSPQSGCSGTVVPFSTEQAPAEPATELRTDFGRFSVWWDTGNPASVVLSEQTVAALRPGYTGPKVKSERLVLGGRNFGPWTIETWKMNLPPWFNGFIGYGFFAQHVVCMDFPGRRILVH